MKILVFMLFSIAFIFSSSAYAEALKPTEDKVLLRLKVEDSQKNPVKGTIVSVQKENGKKIFSDVTDKDGMFGLLVPKGQTYLVKFVSLLAEKTDTLKKINVPDRPFYKFTLKLIYNPTFATTFVLKGIYFDTGKATLKPKSYPNLSNLLEVLKIKKTMEIELSGHTDDVGEDESNRKLSENRAKAVKKYLVKKGISAKRITAVGKGETSPIAPNTTPHGRQKNRRTEVRITKE